MAADLRYHARIVLTHIWTTVRLELRESDITISTIKAPLRRVIAVADITECIVVLAATLTSNSVTSAMSGLDSTSGLCFRITVGSPGQQAQSFTFATDDAQTWVQQISVAVAEARRTQSEKNAHERSAEERLVQDVVARRSESSGDLANAIFSAPRSRPGVLSPFDQLFITCLNDVLAKAFRKSKQRPPILAFSKLDIDLGLAGAKCETMIPVRDSFLVTNNGGTPVELRFDGFERPTVSLKFVPNTVTLNSNDSVEIHITIVFHQTTSLRELVHVSVGPGRGMASIYMSLAVSSKMMEALAFEDIDFGPRLGAGAFGQVFHGAYKKTRECAIKAVGFEPDFDQELAILRELRAHPNIVEYIGACKRKPFQGFIVLEFMSLGSLDKYIHDKSFVFSLQLSLRVSLDTATGLAHLHKSKIMHLDMKPANLLVNSLSLNAQSCVKIADFGLSQSRDTTESFRGEFVEGTLLYMAPEMLREKLFSFKGDIFSFGMTVWEMLARQQPYSGEKHRKLNKAQFEEIRERGELPGDLEAIEPAPVREFVAKMLAYDHEQRPTGEQCIRLIKNIKA